MARKCYKCDKLHVRKAYRHICDPCAVKDKKDGVLLCTKCSVNVKLLKNIDGFNNYAVPNKVVKVDHTKADERKKALEEALDKLKLRERKMIERKIEMCLIKFDYKTLTFVHCEPEEKEFDVTTVLEEEDGGEDSLEDAVDEKRYKLEGVDSEDDDEMESKDAKEVEQIKGSSEKATLDTETKTPIESENPQIN